MLPSGPKVAKVTVDNGATLETEHGTIEVETQTVPYYCGYGTGPRDPKRLLKNIQQSANKPSYARERMEMSYRRVRKESHPHEVRQLLVSMNRRAGFPLDELTHYPLVSAPTRGACPHVFHDGACLFCEHPQPTTFEQLLEIVAPDALATFRALHPQQTGQSA